MLTPQEGIKGAIKHFQNRLAGRPKLINLEVTKLCNAKCDFCDYWQTRHEERIYDYRPVIRKINPLVAVITGGEPMLRKDLPDIVRQIKECSYFIFTSMVTKGDLLTVQKADELFDAGINQIAVSVDFPSERHDVYRGVPGLWNKLSNMLPELGKKYRHKQIIMNTIIMDDNLEYIPELVHKAHEWRIAISFSAYSVMKTNNEDHFVQREKIERVQGVIDELMRLRKELKGTILSTEYYLREIPRYFKTGGLPGCTAGITHIQVTPSGHLKRCSEMPVTTHYSEYHPNLYDKTECTSCWYSCRGETQTPASIKRALEYMGIWL